MPRAIAVQASKAAMIDAVPSQVRGSAATAPCGGYGGGAFGGHGWLTYGTLVRKGRLNQPTSSSGPGAGSHHR
ncbi:MAG: hypothetical protein QOG37_550 [Mycobacterium sp.]|nr:hypothetical protein [Mycobacterium sp.]